MVVGGCYCRFVVLVFVLLLLGFFLLCCCIVGVNVGVLVGEGESEESLLHGLE